MTWHPLDTAPLDRPVDLRVERWVHAGSHLSIKHIRGASWITSTSVRNPVPRWSRVPTGWRATAWAPNTDPAARSVSLNGRRAPSPEASQSAP